MAKLADETQVRSRGVGHMEKVCDTRVVSWKARGKLQQHGAELCAQGADSLGKVLPRLFYGNRSVLRLEGKYEMR